MTAPASLASASAYTACSFKPARSNCRAHRQNRANVTCQAVQEVGELSLVITAGHYPPSTAGCMLFRLIAEWTQKSPGSWAGLGGFSAISIQW